MRPRNPVACRITIGAPSPPQSSVCIRMPLTFTKLDAGSLNFELLPRGSIFSMSQYCEELHSRRIQVSPVGFGLDRRRLLIDSLCFPRADVFECKRLEQVVAHGAHLRQHAVNARIAAAGDLIELDGFKRVRQDDRRRLARQKQPLVQRTRARISLDYKAAGLEPVENRDNCGLRYEEFADERPRRDFVT